jgi:PAS domain S-box-containing protein
MENSTKTILLVEDEALIALQETRQLQKAGYIVIHSLTGEKAIEIVNTNPGGIDVILMDIDLGKGIDGTEAAEQILRTNDIPILFLSSHMEPEIVRKTEEITNYGYVVKSSVFTVLDASIKMALKLFAASRQLDLYSMEIEEKNKELNASLEKLQQTNQRLELSEEKFSKAFYINPDSITLTRISDGVILEVNQGFSEMTGYTHEEAIGKTTLTGDLNLWVHPEIRNLFIQESLEKGKAENVEAEFRRKDGTIFIALLSAHAIEINRQECLISTTRDITERKRIEEILQESESKYRTLFDDAGADIIISDYETNILDANKKCLNNLGYSREELLSMTFYQIDPTPAEEALVEKRMEAIKKTGSFVFRAKRTRKDGSVLPVEVNAMAIVWKRKPAIMSLSRDIADQLETEKALAKFQAILKSTIECQKDIFIVSIDKGFNCLYVNKAYRDRKLAKFGIDVKIGECLLDTLSTDRSFVNSVPYYKRAFAGETLRTIEEIPFLNSTVEVAYSPIYSEAGEIIGATAFGTDITERREVEKDLGFRSILLDEVADSIQVLTPEGKFVYVNEGLCRNFGYTKGEVLGKSIGLLVDSKDAALTGARISAVLQNGRNRFLATYKKKDGTPVPVDVSARLFEVGENKFIAEICRETTEREKMKQALTKSEERFRLAMEATTDGLWDDDLANGSYYYSPAYYRILGYNAADFPQALTWQEFIHPEDREYVLTINQDCIENQRQNFEAQYRVKTKDGIWKWIHCRGKVVSRDSTGKATRMVGTIIDITERVRSEETLRESESKWKSMISASPDGICVVSIDGDIQFASEKCASMLGYDDPDISIGHSIFDYLDTSSQNKAKLYMREIFTGRETHSEEYVLRRKDGSFLYAELNSQVLSDKDNKPNQLMVIIRDITDRKKKEEELAESQQRYFDLLNSMREGFAYVDEADIYRLVNPSFDQIMGQPMIGKSIYDVPDNKGKKILMNESGRRKKGGSSEYVVSIIRPDGQRRWIRVNSSPLYGNDGRYIGRSALHRDITDELKEKAELNQLVKTKETLMKELQHRVKNSLTLVSSLLDIAMNGISDTKAIGVLEDTISRIQSMSAIYERLYLTESVSSIDFGTYVDGIAKSIFNTFSPDSSKIRLSVEAEQIDIDTKRAISLGLIVNELLTNALKYAFPYNRSGVITVSFEKMEQDVSLTVSDDGVGMKDPTILDSSPTMGMTLIRLLASQIGASMKADLSHGTSISIVFKL